MRIQKQLIAVPSPIKTVYKYATPEHAMRMIESGSFRRGTLYEYRSLEGQDVRGDFGEGTHTTTSRREATTYEDGSDVHRALRQTGINVEGTIVTNNENAVHYRQQHPDCYLFCVSDMYSEELVDQFGGRGVVITNVPRFLRALNECIVHRLESMGIAVLEAAFARCMYDARQKPYDELHFAHPCLTKPPHFSKEREWRAVWRVNRGTLFPFILEVPAAKEFVRAATDA